MALSYGGLVASLAGVPGAAAIPVLGELLKPAGDVGKEAGAALKAGIADAPSLSQAKAALADALREAGGRVVVVVDDLDRLMPAEMRAMLSLVKSLGDLPNVFYVLAYDPQVVRKALESERIEPDFVAKIVQVSLALPPPRAEDLRRLLDARLAAATGDAPWSDKRRWDEIAPDSVEPYLRTPRDVVRLANAVQVYWAAVGGDVDLADLVVLTTLRLFEPAIYRLVEEANERLVGVEYAFEKEDSFAAAVKAAQACRPEPAKAAVAALYPQEASGLGVRTYDHSDQSVRRVHRRVCVAGHHRAYFAFGRDALTPARAELDAILEGPDAAGAFDAAIASRGDDLSATLRLLEELEARMRAGARLGEPLLEALIRGSDVLMTMAETHAPLSLPDLRECLSDIVREGARRLDSEARGGWLARIAQPGAGLSLRADVIVSEARAHEVAETRRSQDSSLVFARTDVEAAKHALASEIAGACASGAIWDAPRPLFLLWDWRHLAGRDGPARWIAGLRDSEAPRWARAMMFLRLTSRGFDSTIKTIFRRADAEALFDVEPFIARLEALAATNAEVASALDALREAEANAGNF